MTRKRTAEPLEQIQEQTEMTDPNDTATANLLPPAEDPAEDSQERAASLLQLKRQAQALEQDSAFQDPAEIHQEGGELVPAGADPVSLSNQVQGMVSVMVSLVAPAFPSLQQIYTPQTLATLGDAVAPVMVKHGWNLGDVYGKYAEEITLAMVVIPLGITTYHGVKGDIEARKQEAERQRQEQTQGGTHGG